MLPCEARDRLGALRQEEELVVLAAFFCLLFFAAAKKSRCGPAQGQRLKHEGNTRMPAKKQTHRPAQTGCQRKGKHTARLKPDASAKAKTPTGNARARKAQPQIPAKTQIKSRCKPKNHLPSSQL
jgi:hypothetical protein